MAQTRFYIYDKLTKEESVVGEYQLPFNIGLTLDESKDSCKVIILSNRKQYIEPYTICRLEGFDDLWWIVKKDSVQRHDNDFGFLYEHRLSLDGAIELLNARELISCGFNTNRYTIWSFIERLFKLSNFEYARTYYFNDILDYDEIVNYIKTFENYTLGSAIKEFLNGYNCIPKLRFSVVNNTLDRAIIDIHSKKGLNDSPIDISHFNDTNETSNIDSESFATKVLSNVQNCVSHEVIKFPNIGACNLSTDIGEITYDNVDNAFILLPTNAYYVDSMEFFTHLTGSFSVDGETTWGFDITPDDFSRKGYKCRDEIVNTIRNHYEEERQYLADYVIENWDTIFEYLKGFGIFKLNNGGYYDNLADEIIGDTLVIHSRADIDPNINLFLNNERYEYVTNGEDKFVFSWKQNSNKIKGFGAIKEAQQVIAYGLTHFNKSGGERTFGDITFTIGNNVNDVTLLDNETSKVIPRTLYRVNYIPMSDLRIKSDNRNYGNDTSLYNQNGKLVDGYAVSKLINGYCESVSGGEISRTRKYYNFSDIPSFGRKVKNENEIFVISNISIDVYDNDNNFVYDCDFTLNVYSSCKSTMISANTSIRDYDCPQENNIRRVKNYRDYIEFSYTKDENANDTFLDKKHLITINETSFYDTIGYTGMIDDFCSFFKAADTSFHNVDDGSNNFYYRITNTSFNLEKKKIILFDILDNNIVGYDNRTTRRPFSIRNIFDYEKLISVPISYVDSRGEVDSLELFCVLNSIAEENFEGIYLSGTCIINGEIYNNCKAYSRLTIEEPNYFKDGLEIPVFQYSAEVNGDIDIEVGHDFLEYGKMSSCSMVVVDNAYIDEKNYDLYTRDLPVHNIKITFDEETREFNIFVYNPNDLPLDYEGKTLVISCYVKGKHRLLFALNNFHFIDSQIKFYANFYKMN